jgi:hypothetical protein
MTKVKMIAGAAASALVLSFATASWAVTTISLDTGNSAISGFPGPYGTVTVDLIDAVTADITFLADDSGQYDYFFIGTGAADVNVNADTWTITNLVTNGAGTIADDGAKNVDGFGSFNQTTKQKDGYDDRATQITFTLTDTSGTWASSGSVLAANSNGAFAAAHIAVCDTVANSSCGSAIGAAATGYAAGGPGIITHGGIPEPTTWTMMVLGFFGAGAFIRGRRKSFAVA